MGDNDKNVSFYTDEKTKNEIKRQAEQEGKSVSAWCESVVEQELAERTLEDAAEATNLEGRLDLLLGETEDKLDRLVRDSIGNQSAAAVYSYAIWKLVSKEYGPQKRKNALQDAKEYVESKQGEGPVNEDVIIEEDPDGEETDTEDEPSQGYEFGKPE